MVTNDRQGLQAACEVTLRFPTPAEAEKFKEVWKSNFKDRPGGEIKMVHWLGGNRGKYVYFVGHIVEEI